MTPESRTSPESRVGADPAGSSLRTRSLRGRVTTTVLIFVAVMLLVLGVTTDLALGARLEGELRQRLTDRASYAAVLIDQVSAQDLVDQLEGDGVSVELRTSDGETITKGPLQPASTTTTGPGTTGPGAKPGPKVGPAADPVVQTGDLLQVTRTLAEGSVITLVASAADVRRTLSQVRTTLLVAGVVLLVLAAAALGPIIGRALKPLDQMTATARSITAGDRGRRLRPDKPDTELGRTAAAFDAMLDEVEGAETQARDAEVRLRTFLSDAAHELRTPLTGVQAAAERLLRSDPDRDQREQLSVTVIREARRAGRLVEDMLTMARIDQGIELHRSPVDVTGLAERVAETTRLSFPGLHLTVQGTPSVAQIDPDRVTQVLSNLVDNAVHAAGSEATVGITVTASDGLVVTDVTDDGPGVPPGESERVFERLVRLDQARARTHDGSGLGLSIARGIARAHGGDLVCLPSTLGAHFRLTLPTR